MHALGLKLPGGGEGEVEGEGEGEGEGPHLNTCTGQRRQVGWLVGEVGKQVQGGYKGGRSRDREQVRRRGDGERGKQGRKGVRGWRIAR